MKALVDKCKDLLNMHVYLPGLPATQLSGAFYDDFRLYIHGEEWRSFMRKQVGLVYPSVFPEQPVAFPPGHMSFLFFFSLSSTWGRHIKFSFSMFSGLVLLLSVLVSHSCLSASVLVFLTFGVHSLPSSMFSLHTSSSVFLFMCPNI